MSIDSVSAVRQQAVAVGVASSWQSGVGDRGECQVVVHIEAGDGLQVVHAVFVRQQR